MSSNIDYTAWFTRKDEGPQKILILEDDIELQSSIRDYLALRGCNVYTSQDGAGGIRQVMAMDFDAIICDMIMPNFPGDKFYLATSRVKPHLCERFIFVTGDCSNCHVVEFIRSVNGTVLFKPFRFEDLGCAIDKVLDKRSVERTCDTEARMEAAEQLEGSERYFFGVVCSIDPAVRRFVLHQGTQDRVWTVDCVYPERLKSKVMENLNMRVCVLGTPESCVNSRRNVVNVRSLRIANGPRGSLASADSSSVIIPAA
jgi:DNA-binding response OmpR family regulator